MKSNSSYPILAKEGWGIIGAAIFITLLVWWLIGGFISFIFFVLLVFVIQFVILLERSVRLRIAFFQELTEESAKFKKSRIPTPVRKKFLFRPL